MLEMKTCDGTKFTVTGEEAKDAMGTLKKVIYEHSVLAKTYRVVKQVKKDTTLLVRSQIGDQRCEFERVTLVGGRRAQFRRVLALLSQRPNWSTFRACAQAVRELPAADGYESAASLHRYCLEHKGMLDAAREGKVTVLP